MRYIKGDITKTDLKIIAQCVNCKGVCGSGACLSIRRKFPDFYEPYHNLCKGYGTKNLLGGSFLFKDEETDKVIVNIFGQDGYGREEGVKYARYSAIVIAISTLMDVEVFSGDVLAITKLGCGLGGLKWEIMEELLIELEELYEIEFVVYEKD